MSFFDDARESAAQEYGRRNYERYARSARRRQVAVLLAVLAFALYVLVVTW